jgi:hypothetical protein
VRRGEAPGDEEENRAQEERSGQADEEARAEEPDGGEHRGKHKPIGGDETPKEKAQGKRDLRPIGHPGLAERELGRRDVPGAAVVPAQVVKERSERGGIKVAALFECLLEREPGGQGVPMEVPAREDRRRSRRSSRAARPNSLSRTECS